MSQKRHEDESEHVPPDDEGADDVVPEPDPDEPMGPPAPPKEDAE